MLPVSVIILVGERRERATSALKSVLDQRGSEKIEIIILDASPQLEKLAGVDDERVKVVSVSRKLNIGQMKERGVRVAKGKIIAFLEEHCIAHSNWLCSIIEAHKGNYIGVGGEVHKRNPGERFCDAIHINNYGRWIYPAKRQEEILLPGHNSTYKSEFLRSLENLSIYLECEALLQWKAINSGYKLLLDPSIKFSHLNESNVKVIWQGYYSWHKSFGYYRSKVYQWGVLYRVFNLLIFPVRPFIRIAKMWLAVKSKINKWRFLNLFLQLLLIQFFSSLGIGMGACFGISEKSRLNLIANEIDLKRSKLDDSFKK